MGPPDSALDTGGGLRPDLVGRFDAAIDGRGYDVLVLVVGGP